MKGPFLRTAYNYDRNEAGDESGLDCSVEPSMTHQSFQEECDINTLIMRFGLGGALPVGQRAPTYGDFSGVSDYQQALNAIISADEAFMTMPANVRARFQNDAAQFVDFCSKEENREEAVKLGLVLPQAASLVKQNLPEGQAPVGPAPSGAKP